ncbi:hypothetical protein AQ490_22280 [Wenjunlia vitaminophila]|uniref:Lipoprotein n=1 Tax=Wenjunlia vitaminophila TaxID=76728 RepID=A0A0T6LT10_WENVI|nr:hypothetical protein [Wenjunlia vitaminophila]KRV49041.1 hypothetical protein AQ490_22280 [Wenjunlia vitaminophila]
MKLRRSLALTAAVCALVAGAAACGSDDDPKDPGSPFQKDKSNSSSKPEEKQAESNGVTELSAKEIGDKSLETLKQATSMHMVGTADGAKLDLLLDNSGNCRGTMGLEGIEMEMLRKGESFWLKGDEGFWSMAVGKDADAAKAVVGDRYMLVPAGDEQYGDMVETCDLEKMTASMTEDSAETTYTKGEVTEVNGTPAIELNYKDTDGTGTIYVSTVGKPYPLKVDDKSSTQPAAIVFSDFDKPVDVQAPPDDKVLDVSVLEDMADEGTAA